MQYLKLGAGVAWAVQNITEESPDLALNGNWGNGAGADNPTGSTQVKLNSVHFTDIEREVW